MFTPFSRVDTSGSNFRYAGFWHRLVAVSIDELNLGTISLFILASSSLSFVFAFGGPYHSAASPFGFCFTPAGVAGVLVSGGIILLFLPWLYTALYESSSWQATPGKRMLGLVVKEQDGSRCSFLRSTYKLLVQTFCVIVLSSAVGIALAGIDSIFTGSPLYHLFPAELRCLYHLVLEPLTQLVATVWLLCFALFRGEQTLVDKISRRIVVHEDQCSQTQGTFKAPCTTWKSSFDWLRSTFAQLILLFALCALPLLTGLFFTAGDMWRKLDKATSGSVLKETLPPSQIQPGLFESLSGLYTIRYLFAEYQNQFYLPESIKSVESMLPGFTHFYSDANGIIGDALYAVGKKSAARHFYAHALSVNPHEKSYAMRWSEQVQPEAGKAVLESSFSSPTTGQSPASKREADLPLSSSNSLALAMDSVFAGNLELAKQHLMSIKSGDPDAFKAKQLATYIDLESCRYNGVLDGARALHKLDSSSSSSYAFAANALTRQGYASSALPLALSAVEADPNSSYARACLVAAACRLGLNEFAKEQALLAIKLNADEPEAHLQLAHFYRLQSKLYDARKEINTALALNPCSPSSHRERYEIERRLGDFSNLSSDLVFLNAFSFRPIVSPESVGASRYADAASSGLSSEVESVFKFLRSFFH